jgi:hypothetical protein
MRVTDRQAPVTVLLLLASLLATASPAAAQEPVRDFTQLNTRLRPGDTVWVTDAQGREVEGKIQTLTPDALTLRGDGPRTVPGRDVSLIRQRQPDGIWNGALIGLAAGGGLAAAGCIAEKGYSDSFCPAYIVLYPAMGLGLGVAIDALIPGKKLVAYRAPGSSGAARSRFSVAPLITPRAKGAAFFYSF